MKLPRRAPSIRLKCFNGSLFSRVRALHALVSPRGSPGTPTLGVTHVSSNDSSAMGALHWFAPPKCAAGQLVTEPSWQELLASHRRHFASQLLAGTSTGQWHTGAGTAAAAAVPPAGAGVKPLRAPLSALAELERFNMRGLAEGFTVTFASMWPSRLTSVTDTPFATA